MQNSLLGSTSPLWGSRPDVALALQVTWPSGVRQVCDAHDRVESLACFRCLEPPLIHHRSNVIHVAEVQFLYIEF